MDMIAAVRGPQFLSLLKKEFFEETKILKQAQSLLENGLQRSSLFRSEAKSTHLKMKSDERWMRGVQ